MEDVAAQPADFLAPRKGGLPRRATILSNPDNVDYGDLTHIDDGSENGITAITERGIESAGELLADIRTWPGGIRQFLVDDHCDPETVERIMADEAKR
jgi:hypothetical protein